MEPSLSPLKRLLSLADLGAAIAVVGIVLMLIIPLPPVLLDSLMIINLCASLLAILMAMQIRDPLEFSVFPTLLLITTLFRLGLDVSATRMILLHGHIKDPVTALPIGAGHLIPAFGQVVVGGNLLVGVIMFVILIVIQIIVIAKGAERIAQVAARFTLDGMPMKFMAIDNEVAAGVLSQEQARERRLKVEAESDFYGSMDGAGKFIQGDAIAAIIIMVVNVVAGILMGVGYHGMVAFDALNTFAILSIGNGLITTLPAFLMSTSMGLLVSRAASSSRFGPLFADQILQQPEVLRLGSAFMGLLALLSVTDLLAFPWPPFAVLALMLHWTARQLIVEAQHEVQEEVQKTEEVTKQKQRDPDQARPNLQVDALSLEVGRGLLHLVDPGQGAKLLERVTSIRRHIASELGIIVPGVRFRDNLQLKPQAYVIKVRELEVAQGEVVVNQFLAIGPEEKLRNLRGQKTVDPTYAMPAVWLPPEQRADAERLGCMIFDPVSVIATQMTETVRNHAADLLSHQDVQNLLDTLKKTNPAVVRHLLPDGLSLPELRVILQNLIRERVSIRDLVVICETLVENLHFTKEPELLSEIVRVALARNICREYVNNENTINVMTLDPLLEQSLQASLTQGFSPQLGQEVLAALAEQIATFSERGLQPIALTSPPLRPHVRRLAERSFPQLVVLSWNEIAPKVKVNSVAMVSV